MFLDLIQRILSFGVDEKMEQFVVNRAKRINFFYMILIVMLSLSVICATFTGLSTVVLLNGIGLALVLLCYFYIPISRKANLSSMLVLSLTALILFHGYQLIYPSYGFEQFIQMFYFLLISFNISYINH